MEAGTRLQADTQSWDWGRARRWCRHVAVRCAGVTAADDIAQEAVLRAWRARHSCRDPERPWAWLAQITRNEAVRHAGRRDAEPVDGDDRGDPEDAGEATDAVVERLALEEALMVLSELDRLLVRLYYERDLSVASLAEISGLTPGAVKVRMHRARARLRAALDQP